ncbi:MAG: beta strand repeat-containing protein, partial [Flavobacteriales bacterium]
QTPCTASCNGGPPPANDACGGAMNLGAVPTPPLCSAGTGVGTPVNFNLTNVCATAEPNYTSLLGCTPAGNQASPAADVWYRITLVAPILNVTINGLGTPNVALYEGTNCTNMIPRGCAIGSGGYLNTQFQGLAAGTYYLQISGGDVLDQCTFTLTLQNNYDCAGCVLAADLNVTPPPVNGQYQPNTLVTFCYTITSYQQTSANWLHGVIPSFSAGWDMSTFVPLATTTVGGLTGSSCNSTGTWSWYNANVTSTATGATTGPGFYFETIAGNATSTLDGNPGNNFGDYNPGACQWTFCWQIRTKPLTNCIQDQSLNMVVNTTGDGESGSWSSLGCTQDPLVNFFAQMNCCPLPTVTSTNVLCYGQATGSATATALGTGPWTYVWKNAAGVTLQTNANVAGSSTINNLAAGDYVVQVTDATNCVSLVAFTITQPSPLTAAVSVVSSPICSGSTATFNFTGTPNATIAYTLNGGASQNIVLSAAGTASLTTAALSSNASLTLVSVSTASPNCVQVVSGTATVNVLTLPTANIGNGISVCYGTSGNISFTGTPNAIVSYSVNGGANQTLTIGANGTALISTGNLTANATYSLSSVSLPGAVPCTQAVTGTAVVTVVPLPTASVSANLTPCLGGNAPLQFTGTPGANVLFSINGGASQNIVLSTAGTAQYSPNVVNAPMTVTLVSVSTVGALVCTQALSASITITPRPAPTATASVLSPVCAGATSTVTFTGTPNTTVNFTYNGVAQTATIGATGTGSWTTPALNAAATISLVSVFYNSGSACLQNITGTYTINVSAGVTPTFNPIGPYCFGVAPPALPTTSANGVTGTWSPASVNTQIIGVTNYTFTPSAGTGCASTPVVVAITVYERPLVFGHGTNPTCTTICNGTAVVDVTGGLAPYTYAWSNGGITASISNLCVGTYNVTVTDANGCQSQAFTPVSGCFQIQSILVDACGDGNQEGLNEMVFFQVGSAPLNTTGASATFPSNSFVSFNCSNQAFIDAVNATITGGGVLLPVPAGGTIPANSNVVIITSNATTSTQNSFTQLSDTLYVMFHCSSVTAGYFGNTTATVTPRTLTLNFGAGCTDAVTYNNNLLVNINGTTGGSATVQNGSYVNFSQSGAAVYANYGCLAPFGVQDNSVVLTAPSPVTPTFALVGPYCSGATIPALPTTSNEGITGTWSPAINNTAT